METCVVSGWISKDYRLKAPVEVWPVMQVEGWYTASVDAFPLEGTGDTPEEAVNSWITEIAFVATFGSGYRHRAEVMALLVYDPAVANDVRPLLRWGD